MRGVELIKEMESLIKEKLELQESTSSFYEMVDDSIRQELLIGVFDKIDQNEALIQEKDLLFLTKFEQFKKLNDVEVLNALEVDERQVFINIRKIVERAADFEALLKDFKLKTEATRLRIHKDLREAIIMNRASSAYKNINIK